MHIYIFTSFLTQMFFHYLGLPDPSCNSSGKWDDGDLVSSPPSDRNKILIG